MPSCPIRLMVTVMKVYRSSSVFIRYCYGQPWYGYEIAMYHDFREVLAARLWLARGCENAAGKLWQRW